MAELALAPLERILRKAGAQRVSEDAVKAMADILEDVAADIAGRAVALARHAGRKTVKADDVKMAARE